MKIPNGFTEQEVMKIINTVINSLAGGFVFGCHTKSDIKQEAFVFALEALPGFDGKRPLDGFLFQAVKNRLINFKRDNYFRPDSPEHLQKVRKNLTNLESIENPEETVICPNSFSEIADAASYNEMVALIRKRLPLSLLPDFNRLISGVKISKPRTLRVQESVTTILKLENDG